MADRLSGDQRVVGADGRAGLLQPGAHDAGGVRVEIVELLIREMAVRYELRRLVLGSTGRISLCG